MPQGHTQKAKLSNAQLCQMYDVAVYEDSRRPGKFFVATTIGTVADRKEAYIPLAQNREEAEKLAVEHLELEDLYQRGVRSKR